MHALAEGEVQSFDTVCDGVAVALLGPRPWPRLHRLPQGLHLRLSLRNYGYFCPCSHWQTRGAADHPDSRRPTVLPPELLRVIFPRDSKPLSSVA